MPHGYCHTTITNCSYKKEQLTAHKVYCERKHTKSAHFMISGVTNAIKSISQGKQQTNTSNKTDPHTNTKLTKIFMSNPRNTNKMAHSSCTKSSVSIDSFNLLLLPDARRQTTMFCEIPNDFFLPDGKNTQLSHIINTWTFDRLTPNGNEGVGVQINYLEHAYGTKYYVVDKVNGKINAIHDDSLELMEFKGHFSPFNLEQLEMRVHRLADQNKDEDDLPEPQHAPQTQDSDSNLGLLSIEDMTGMGFDPNNYSPIPPVGNAASQQPGAALPTSTPRPVGGADFNTSDPTHNRGKAKIINSFTESQEPLKKLSKGGKIKSSQGVQHKKEPQPSTSSQTPSNGKWRPLVHCSACGGDHLRKDCHSDTVLHKM